MNSNCLDCEKIGNLKYRNSDKGKQTILKRYISKYTDNPIPFMYDRAKGRARRAGIPFDIDMPYLRSIWPKDGICPVLGTKLSSNTGGKKHSPNSPSLDKIRPSLGYVRGNVAIISWEANKMKMDTSTPENLRKLADWLEKQLDKTSI